MSSIFHKFEATGVHHHGLQKWKMIDAIIIKTNIIATNTFQPSFKIPNLLFTTFVVLKQCSIICSVFFFTKTTSHFEQWLCQLDAVLKFNLNSNDNLQL